MIALSGEEFLKLLYKRTEEGKRSRLSELEPIEDHHFSGCEKYRKAPGPVDVLGSGMQGVILAELAHKFGGPVLELGATNGVATRYIHQGLMTHPYVENGKEQIVVTVGQQEWGPDKGWQRRMCIANHPLALAPIDELTLQRLGPFTFGFVCLQGKAAQKAATLAMQQGAQKLVFFDQGNIERPTTTRSEVLDLFAWEPHRKRGWQIYDIKNEFLYVEIL